MAAITDLSICNQALIVLGGTVITSLTQDIPNARLCNALYDQKRDDVLTDHIWNFAQKRIALTVSTDPADPVWDDDSMTEIYDKPSDCLKINFVNIKSAVFKIEGDKILSNVSGLKVKYTEAITDPAKFFSKFVEALIARMSAEMAYAITSSRTLADSLFTIYYKVKLPQAIAVDSQQGTPQAIAQDDILISRISGSGSIVGRTGQETWYPC